MNEEEYISSVYVLEDKHATRKQDSKSEIALLKQKVDLLKKELSDVRRALAGMKKENNYGE